MRIMSKDSESMCQLFCLSHCDAKHVVVSHACMYPIVGEDTVVARLGRLELQITFDRGIIR